MSGIWQASVTHHSKLPEQLKHLLYLLADVANDAGMVDPAPSQETLASLTNCTSRTVRTRMAAILKSGELVQTRVGAGPGKPSAYEFKLPLPPNMKAEGKAENTGRLTQLENELAQQALRQIRLEQQIARLEEQITGLSALVSDLTAPLNAEKGGNNHVIFSAFSLSDEEENRKKAETKAENTGKETGKYRKENRKIPETKAENTGKKTAIFSDDPVLIPFDPKCDPNAPAPASTPASTPTPAPADKTAYTFTSETAAVFNGRFEAMVTALEDVTRSRRSLVGGKLESASLKLLEAGYQAEEVLVAFGKGGWWYVTGFGKKDGAPPQIGNVLNDIGKAAKTKTARPRPDAPPPATDVADEWDTAPAPLGY